MDSTPADYLGPTGALSFAERVNFLLTNRIPRRWATLLIGRIARIESRLLTRFGMAIWQLLGGSLALHEAEERSFTSLQNCFTRRLKPGVRQFDMRPDVLASPCDGIVGAHGAIDGTTVYQAKGYPYSLEELLGDTQLAARFAGGHFVTLRLRSNMYHRFHAPAAATIDELRYISGDTWNVNPVALRCVERLFCRNERAVLQMHLPAMSQSILLVPVAAVLVASMQFAFLRNPIDLRYRGPNRIECSATFSKGDEVGHFRLGSTILVFTSPELELHPAVYTGRMIRCGEPLLNVTS